VPITSERPILGSVFGHMNPDDEAGIRSRILTCGRRLGALGTELGGGSSAGVELQLMERGQVEIAVNVGASDQEQNGVVFGAVRRPSWSRLPRRQSDQTQSWLIETWIDADCLHSVDHGAMESVFAN